MKVSPSLWVHSDKLLLQQQTNETPYNVVIPACPESFFVFRKIPDALCLRE